MRNNQQYVALGRFFRYATSSFNPRSVLVQSCVLKVCCFGSSELRSKSSPQKSQTESSSYILHVKESIWAKLFEEGQLGRKLCMWLHRRSGEIGPRSQRPCPVAISQRLEKVFWTWLEEISSNMRGAVSPLNVYCGGAMIEVCLWSKKSAIRWVFGPQTAFE